MGQTEATRQADFITPPRAGEITVLATGAASSQDLRLCGPQNENMAIANQSVPHGLPGHYATFEADGQDVYVIFGPTNASVTGANAPVIGTNGVNAAGCCFRIPSAQALSVKLEVGVDSFVGFVSPAAGQLRIIKSST